MPNYSYICLNCDHTFDETHLMKDHDKPMKKPCPKCKKKKIEKNWSLQANAVGVDATMSPTKVMGGAWKEVMDRIKNNGQVPKRFHERLDRSTDFRNGSVF